MRIRYIYVFSLVFTVVYIQLKSVVRPLFCWFRIPAIQKAVPAEHGATPHSHPADYRFNHCMLKLPFISKLIPYASMPMVGIG